MASQAMVLSAWSSNVAIRPPCTSPAWLACASLASSPYAQPSASRRVHNGPTSCENPLPVRRAQLSDCNHASVSAPAIFRSLDMCGAKYVALPRHHLRQRLGLGLHALGQV